MTEHTQQETQHVPEFIIALSAFFGTKDKEYFMENLGMLIGSGSTVTESLGAIKKGIRTLGIKVAVTRAQEHIDNGETLSHALRDTGLVRPHTAELIDIAERSGRLTETLSMVAEQEEKDRLFRYKIRSAMMYPIFVLSLTVLIGVGIAWFILPRLATVFDQLDLELPVVTQWLIAIGEVLEAHGVFIVPALLLGLAFVLFLLFGYHKTRHVGLFLLFHTPGIRQLFQEIELARMGHTLGSLLRAGLSITTALQSLQQVASLPPYARFYNSLGTWIEEGNSFARSFELFPRSDRLIPRPVQQLIISGERSGTLAETFSRIGVYYEEKTDVSAKNLSVILEPIMLVIVWGGVVSVALAVMLPIYNLVGGLNVEDQAGNTPRRAPVETQVRAIVDDVDDSVVEESVDREDPVRTLLLNPNETGALNVRQEPEADADIVGSAVFGTEYVYEDYQDGWYEIIFDEEEGGWISEDFVSVVDGYELR